MNTVSKRPKKCEFRHENGNCLKIGGFCTSISLEKCPKAKTDKPVTDCNECMGWDSIHGGCMIHNTIPGGCKDFRRCDK